MADTSGEYWDGKGRWLWRNWKWAVPVAGLGLGLMVVGAIAVLGVYVQGVVRDSEPYKEAIAKAGADTKVTAMLGDPLTAGWLVTGSFNLSESSATGSTGEADFTIPVSGRKGQGSIHVVGSKRAGKWTLAAIEVSGPGGVIPVVTGAPSSVPPSSRPAFIGRRSTFPAAGAIGIE